MGEGALVVYYNEIDPYCCQWLRNLIVDEQLPFGEVDQRDIREVTANDVKGYSQCHFFAGIGGWAYALSLAGWPADRGVWTGSCPCQPFSCAGKRRGEADDRHLWPDWGSLISVCRPPVVFGEQVAGRAGRVWLSGVRADLEAMGYGVGAADLCAAGTGAPHIRQRLFWVADRAPDRRQQVGEDGRGGIGGSGAEGRAAGSGLRGALGGVADANQARRQPIAPESRISLSGNRAQRTSEQLIAGGASGRLEHAPGRGKNTAQQPGQLSSTEQTGSPSRLADRLSPRLEERAVEPAREECAAVERGGDAGRLAISERPERWENAEYRADNLDEVETRQQSSSGPRERGEPSGFWSSYSLIPCLDGKTRRIEPGSFPLAHGVSARVGKLRAYGNAIVPQVAAEFIKAYMDCR